MAPLPTPLPTPPPTPPAPPAPPQPPSNQLIPNNPHYICPFCGRARGRIAQIEADLQAFDERAESVAAGTAGLIEEAENGPPVGWSDSDDELYSWSGSSNGEKALSNEDMVRNDDEEEEDDDDEGAQEGEDEEMSSSGENTPSEEEETHTRGSDVRSPTHADVEYVSNTETPSGTAETTSATEATTELLTEDPEVLQHAQPPQSERRAESDDTLARPTTVSTRTPLADVTRPYNDFQNMLANGRGGGNRRRRRGMYAREN